MEKLNSYLSSTGNEDNDIQASRKQIVPRDSRMHQCMMFLWDISEKKVGVLFSGLVRQSRACLGQVMFRSHPNLWFCDIKNVSKLRGHEDEKFFLCISIWLETWKYKEVESQLSEKQKALLTMPPNMCICGSAHSSAYTITSPWYSWVKNPTIAQFLIRINC